MDTESMPNFYEIKGWEGGGGDRIRLMVFGWPTAKTTRRGKPRLRPPVDAPSRAHLSQLRAASGGVANVQNNTPLIILDFR